jgi:hypothetical protein
MPALSLFVVIFDLEDRKVPITGSMLRGLAWRKAKRSVANGACVELASFNGMIAMRDSKDPDGPVLVYTPAELSAFLHGAKAGEFDDLC